MKTLHGTLPVSMRWFREFLKTMPGRDRENAGVRVLNVRRANGTFFSNMQEGGKKMEESDYGNCDEILSELVLEEGEIVYGLEWDSGSPAIGGGYEVVYKFREYYWAYSDYEGLCGPYNRFDKALSSNFTTVTEATQSIRCNELSSEEIAERLEPYDLECNKRIVINGEDWVITPEGCCMKKSIPGRRSGKVIKLYNKPS